MSAVDQIQTGPAPVPAAEAASEILCVTQDAREQEAAWERVAEFIEICTVRAELTARGQFCPPECGGHPICRACYELQKKKGWLR